MPPIDQSRTYDVCIMLSLRLDQLAAIRKGLVDSMSREEITSTAYNAMDILHDRLTKELGRLARLGKDLDQNAA